MTPISLLAYITLTSTVSARIASRNSSRSSKPSAARTQDGDAASGRLQRARRVQHRFVLGGHSHNVRMRGAGRGHHALQRQIVRLRRAAREHDFARARAGQFRDLPARHLHRGFGFPSEAVGSAGCVSELGSESTAAWRPVRAGSTGVVA